MIWFIAGALRNTLVSPSTIASAIQSLIAAYQSTRQTRGSIFELIRQFSPPSVSPSTIFECDLVIDRRPQHDSPLSHLNRKQGLYKRTLMSRKAASAMVNIRKILGQKVPPECTEPSHHAIVANHILPKISK